MSCDILSHLRQLSAKMAHPGHWERPLGYAVGEFFRKGVWLSMVPEELPMSSFILTYGIYRPDVRSSGENVQSFVHPMCESRLLLSRV